MLITKQIRNQMEFTSKKRFSEFVHSIRSTERKAMISKDRMIVGLDELEPTEDEPLESILANIDCLEAFEEKMKPIAKHLLTMKEEEFYHSFLKNGFLNKCFMMVKAHRNSNQEESKGVRFILMLMLFGLNLVPEVSKVFEEGSLNAIFEMAMCEDSPQDVTIGLFYFHSAIEKIPDDHDFWVTMWPKLLDKIIKFIINPENREDKLFIHYVSFLAAAAKAKRLNKEEESLMIYFETAVYLVMNLDKQAMSEAADLLLFVFENSLNFEIKNEFIQVELSNSIFQNFLTETIETKKSSFQIMISFIEAKFNSKEVIPILIEDWTMKTPSIFELIQRDLGQDSDYDRLSLIFLFYVFQYCPEQLVDSKIWLLLEKLIIMLHIQDEQLKCLILDNFFIFFNNILADYCMEFLETHKEIFEVLLSQLKAPGLTSTQLSLKIFDSLLCCGNEIFEKENKFQNPVYALMKETKDTFDRLVDFIEDLKTKKDLPQKFQNDIEELIDTIKFIEEDVSEENV